MKHRAQTCWISLEDTASGKRPTLWDAPGKGRQEARFRLFADGSFEITSVERFGLVAARQHIQEA